MPQRRPIPAPWQRQASGSLMPAKRCFAQNASIQAAKMCVLLLLWVIQRFSNYIGAQKVISQDLSPASHLLANDTPRMGCWGRYAQNYKSSLGNGLAACQNCSKRTHCTPSAEPKEPPHTSIDKSQVLQGECVWRDGHSICRWLPLQSQGQFKKLERVWSGSTNDQCPPQHSN